MNKILLLPLLIFLFISCSGDNNKNEEEEEDCGCVKTTYNARTNGVSGTRVVAVENVPCQNNESYVFVSGDRNAARDYVHYYICCDNIDDPNSGCNDL